MVRNLVGLNRLLPWVPRFKSAQQPTVFHITHHKAGSQWINRIFHALAYERVVHPEVANAQFLDRPIEAGRVYPTVYVTREQYESVRTPRDSRRFVVIRDLRDTLVSMYFSLRYSHQLLTARIKSDREVLADVPQEDGLVYCIQTQLAFAAQVQWSWARAGEPVIKYEDLLVRDEAILTDVLLRRCRLGVDPGRFREAVLANRFANFSGRAPGEEDVRSHERKGIAGDWRNYFTERVTTEFKRWYGSVLIATGYEADFKW